jgi:hypothetical protein
VSDVAILPVRGLPWLADMHGEELLAPLHLGSLGAPRWRLTIRTVRVGGGTVDDSKSFRSKSLEVGAGRAPDEETSVPTVGEVPARGRCSSNFGPGYSMRSEEAEAFLHDCLCMAPSAIWSYAPARLVRCRLLREGFPGGTGSWPLAA